MGIRLSIRYKILVVVGVLLLSAVAFYTLLASTIFRQEKTALLYDINHSVAVNIASQLRASILQTSQQLKLYLFTQLSSQENGNSLEKSLKEAHIIGVNIYKKKDEQYLRETKYDKFPLSNFDVEKRVRELSEAEASGNSVWNESSETPRSFLASKIEVHESKDVIYYYVVAELDRSLFFSFMQSANIFQSFLSDQNGQVLFALEKSHPVELKSVDKHPLLAAAVENRGITSGVLAFSFLGKQWYGAYAPVGISNLYFISQADQSEVVSATRELIRQSFLFGLIALTATFLASILFSKHLTQNLKQLNESTRFVGQGNLNAQINIKSGDEIEELADAFNQMMSALKASRDAIEKYNRELEGKVAERTKELHEKNAAIKEVQEQLLKSTQLAAVGEVAGRTAHEVLNPLTAILGRIEKTKNDVDSTKVSLPVQLEEIINAWDTEYKKGGFEQLVKALQTPSTVQPGFSLFEEDLANLKSLCTYWTEEHRDLSGHLQFVQNEASRIHRIVDKMRQLVRSSDVLEDVRCHMLLKEAVSTMTDFFEKQGLVIKFDSKAELDLARMNHDEFIQIITNLLRNSYQAIAAGKTPNKGVIQIRTRNENGSLLIEIEDNGLGIPEEKQAHIFEQGFTTKNPAEGTGLGLSICRRYARAFGGDVELKASQMNEYTIFVVRVPLLEGNLLKIAV